MAIVHRTQALTGHTNKRDYVTSPSVQSVKVDATAGQFKLTFDGSQTADIAFNASAATVKSALVAASDVLEDHEADLVVTGGPGNAGGTTPYVVTFPDLPGYDDTPLMTGANGTTPLSGGAATITITETGDQAVASHHTDVITDPNAGNAVQTPIAQQTGGLDSQNDPTPLETLG